VFVLSPGAKKFLTALLTEMYGFTFDLDKIAIRFGEHIEHAGIYDPNGVESITLDRAWWEARRSHRTLQLEMLAHELVHAAQVRMYRYFPGTKKHDLDAEQGRSDNYTLTQKLVRTPIKNLDKKDLGNTEDQLGQRLMYEIAKRLGDEREYTEHWKMEPAPEPDLSAGP
jgi:hypothetical protein